MAFLLTQAGSTLYKVNLSSGTATALTLPTGVTLSTTRKPKFALLNQWVAMVCRMVHGFSGLQRSELDRRGRP